MFSQKYPKIAQMLSSDVVCAGVYRADAEQPELSTPFASCLWELTLLAVRAGVIFMFP